MFENRRRMKRIVQLQLHPRSSGYVVATNSHSLNRISNSINRESKHSPRFHINPRKRSIVGTPYKTTMTKPMMVRGMGFTPTDGINAMSNPNAANRQKLRNATSQSPFLSLCGRQASRATRTMASTTMFPMTCAQALGLPNAINPALAIIARTSGANQK